MPKNNYTSREDNRIFNYHKNDWFINNPLLYLRIAFDLFPSNYPLFPGCKW